MRRAFVSHSTSDDRYVAEMESFLRKAAGFDDVFNDVSSIQPDEKFWPAIEEGIASCDALVVVITSASNASEWVKREVEYARGLSKKIIPVWIEDCPIPPIFADRDVIDFRPGTRQERRFEISRIVKYVPAELIGREDETKLLNDAWKKVLRIEKGRAHVLTFVALGGEGKTSLVAKWAAELAGQDWPGCDAAFAWSFYSQGAREQVAASSDLFLKEALTFFGDDADKAFAASPAGAFEKGQRLARLVGQRRSLLILDGLEPLQYPSSATAFKPGELKDQGVAKLLKDLASSSRGLCIVTTRIELPDLQAFKGGAVTEIHLKRLSRNAGVHLLKLMGVKGSELRKLPVKDGDEKSEKVNEFEKLVEDVKGHALTLTLLGGFLQRAFRGDIRQRDRVKFEKADEKMDGGRAFRTMAAYEEWLLRDGGDEGRREVAVLRLMGLFARPADAGCLAALRSETIPGLTEPLAGLADDDWEFCLSGLETAKLLTVNRDASGALVSLDAHPHLREYFARQLRTQQPDAWRAAHRRLYEHLCAIAPECTRYDERHSHWDSDKPQPTLEDLQPLYQAVAHGCEAGLQKEASDKVYRDRILRGWEVFSTKKLGAIGNDLEAIACFFEVPWSRVAPVLDGTWQAWMLNEAAIRLRASGRLAEALTPMRAGLEQFVAQEQWKNAAGIGSNLSELELTLGEVAGALIVAKDSVTLADRSGDSSQRRLNRDSLADVLHQMGRRPEAEALFREAEKESVFSGYVLNFLRGGFQRCDLHLDAPERAAWRQMLALAITDPRPVATSGVDYSGRKHRGLAEFCSAARSYSMSSLASFEARGFDNSILTSALDHLTLARATLYMAILEGESLDPCSSFFQNAIDGLRYSGNMDDLPRGLLTYAWLRFLTGARTGPESAQEDLNEAWEIAERGPMKLHLADIHLYRARLFGNRKAETGNRKEEMKYPWESPAADLAAAEKLINSCGYHRRDEELADAKAVILAP